MHRTDRTRHLTRVDWSPSTFDPPDLSSWPFAIPAIAQLIEEGGLDIAPGVTFLIGENGTGKSTLIEALATSYPRTGFISPYVRVTGPSPSLEDSPLPGHLRAHTHPQASPAGFFLRSETMHAYLESVDSDPNFARSYGGIGVQNRSHGETFLNILRHRFADIGVYFMDEPEAALSFRSCLGLVAFLHQMSSEGSQVVVATHSPLLVSLPGASLIELGEWGMRTVDSYKELEVVQKWTDFMGAPQRYLRHLLDGLPPTDTNS